MQKTSLSAVPCAVALAMCTVFTTQAAQTEDIDWLPSFKANERVAYEVKRCRKVDHPTRPVDACHTGVIEIEVLSANDAGSRQRWSSDAMLDRGSLPAPAQDALAVTANFAMEFEFNADAQPVRVVNAAALRAKLDEALDVMLAPRDGKAPDPKLAAGVKTLMTQLTSTDEKLLALAGKDASILYSLLGGVYRPGTTLEFKSSLPSPFGTAPLQSAVRVATQRTAAPAPPLEIQVDEDIDREALLQAIEAVVQPLLQSQPGAAGELRKAMSSMTMKRVTTYQVKPDEPWPVSVRFRQTVDVQGRRRVDDTEYRRVR